MTWESTWIPLSPREERGERICGVYTGCKEVKTLERALSLTALVFTRHSRLVFTRDDRGVFTTDDRPVFTTRDRLMFTTGAVRLHSPPTYAGWRSESGAPTHELSA